MSMKPYPEYASTNLPLLGSLPRHWEATRLGVAVNVKKEIVGEKWSDFLLLSLTLNGVIPRDMENRMGKLPSDFTTYQRVTRGDLIFCLFDVEETPRTVGWVPKEGMLTGAYTAASINTEFDARYVAYHYLSYDQSKSLRGYYAGLRNTIRAADFKNIPIAFPSLEEQQAIVSYLDRETAEIDAFIADQEELIELLSERRTATITRAVTKGLDPNAPMKDSEVEWLGEIPADWSITKLSWAARCSSGTSLSNEKFDTVSSGDLSIPVIGGNGVTGYTNMSNIDSSRIVIGRVGALCGNVHFVQSPAWITDNALRLIIDESFFNPIYLAHLLRARNLNNLADKTAQPLITGSLVASQRIPCPPLNVQHLIANHISQEIFEFDAAIADAREAIALSKERRAAVISAAVTGKIDVRNFMSPATADDEGASVDAA